MKSSNTVTANDIVVEYQTVRGTVRTLEHKKFIAQGGSSVAIMGPSGCGKSTLLGLLAGLAVPTQGSVSVGETEISSLDDAQRVAFRKRHIGMVYQADNLLPFLTVFENVYIQLSLCEDTHDSENRILNILMRLGLEGLESRLPDQLSGGQRQRVAIARAIVHTPGIILADEPTGALDDSNADKVVDQLLDTHTRLGATLILVTHDPRVAARMEYTVNLSRTQGDA